MRQIPKDQKGQVVLVSVLTVKTFKHYPVSRHDSRMKTLFFIVLVDTRHLSNSNFFLAYDCISSVVFVTNSATLYLDSRERKVQIITSSSFENKLLALINVYPYSSDWYSSYKIRNSSSVIELSAKEITSEFRT